MHIGNIENTKTEETAATDITTDKDTELRMAVSMITGAAMDTTGTVEGMTDTVIRMGMAEVTEIMVAVHARRLTHTELREATTSSSMLRV